MTTRLTPHLLLLALSAGMTTRLSAQSTVAGPPIVKADLVTGTFDKALPFDQAFVIEVPVLTNVSRMRLRFGYAADTVIDGYHATIASGDTDTKMWRPPRFEAKTAMFLVKGWPANRRMVLLVDSLVTDSTKKDPYGKVVTDVNGRPETFQYWLTDRYAVVGATSARFTDYFRSDFGVIWAPPPGPAYVAGATNVHVYLRPANDNADPRTFQGWDQLLKRVSLFAGLAVFKFKSGEPVENQFITGNAQGGISLRPLIPHTPPVLNSLYFNVGIVYFVQNDPNPLIVDRHGKHAPFVGIGGAIAWGAVFGPFATFFGAK